MTQAFKIWIISFVITVAFVWVCYQWLDRSIALWVGGTFGSTRAPDKLVYSPISSSSISALVFVVCGLVAVSGRRFSKLETTIATCAISTVSTILIKDQLKFVFGRTWPETWSPGIVSFLRNGAYGFHYFHSGRSFESFPSGHAAVAAAVLSVPFLLFPRVRMVAATCIVAVDVSLVMLNLHFLSDVIGGSFLGFSIGLFSIYLWRAINSGSAAEVSSVGSDSLFQPPRPIEAQSDCGEITQG